MSGSSSYLAIVPVSLLVTISFFVLLGISRAVTKALKVLGYVACGLLWLGALLILLGGFCSLIQNSRCRRPMMYKKMMQSSMHEGRMPPMMMREGEGMPMQVKGAPEQQKDKSGMKCPNRGIIYQKR